jgi:hypothetical protein
MYYRFFLFFCIFFSFFGEIVTAQVVSPFNIRYQTNQKGGIVILSNVSLTCNGNNPNCGTFQQQVPPAGNHNQDGNIVSNQNVVNNQASNVIKNITSKFDSELTKILTTNTDIIQSQQLYYPNHKNISVDFFNDYITNRNEHYHEKKDNNDMLKKGVVFVIVTCLLDWFICSL